MKKRKRYGAIIVFTTIISMLLVGCGAGNVPVANNEKEEDVVENNTELASEIVQETRIVEHKMGSTEIPVEPKKIFVTIQRLADPMFALGIKPHVITVYGDPEYLGEYLDDVKLIEGFPITPEAILAEEPDLIIADPWVNQERYEQLSKIAPTVVIDDNGEGWRGFFPVVAKVFDKEAVYEQWMKDYDKRANEAKQMIKEQLGDETVMVLRIQQDFIAPWSINGSASKVLISDLGLNIHEKITGEWTQISLEALPEFDADHIFLEVRSTTEGSEKYFNENLKDSSIWNNMKAVKNGNVYPILTDLWIEGDGPIGRSKMIGEVLDYLTK